MLKKVLVYHLIPISIAIAISTVLIYLTVLFSSKTDNHIVKEGTQLKTRDYYENLIEEQAQIDFYASLKNEKQLTILGSSEFTSTPYIPFLFFPDSLGIPAMGVGHAYHQSFSILSELLAADEYVENSKICIVLSLSWFNTEGTNTGAFIEFVRPNLLNNIIQNKKIDIAYKKHIGAYIDGHYHEIDGITNDMEQLRDLYSAESNISLIRAKSNLRLYLKKISQRETVKYNLKLASLEPKKWNDNLSTTFIEMQKDFVSKITNNQIYVYDDYYAKYLIDDDGKVTVGTNKEVDLVQNNELNDFFLLVKYLKSKNANCSFVIQPLNPYFYNDLQKFDGLVEVLTKKLDDYKFPYLNMHVNNKDKYEPGVLKDVMHLGDVGWIKVNSFLKNVYYAN